MPFKMPTKAVASPAGDIYVSDGYGQSRVHRFSADGELLRSWGSQGTGPGQFTTPHAICIDNRGRVLVADRGNNRIQVFDAEGAFLDEWAMPAPNDVYIDNQDNVYASDGVFNLEGERLAQVEGMMGHILSFTGVQEASRLRLTKVEGMMGHSLCVDSRGDIYWSTVGQVVPGRGFAETPNLVKKFERL
jgi:sugar lactone lactonase YvrE